jgi:putative membrane protein
VHRGDYGFFGMHLLWWIFWVLAIVLLLSVAPLVPKGKTRAREAPLEILQRRNARGGIDAAEYEEPTSRLTRDQAA